MLRILHRKHKDTKFFENHLNQAQGYHHVCIHSIALAELSQMSSLSTQDEVKDVSEILHRKACCV